MMGDSFSKDEMLLFDTYPTGGLTVVVEGNRPTQALQLQPAWLELRKATALCDILEGCDPKNDDIGHTLEGESGRRRR